jgi:hypothetical protein
MWAHIISTLPIHQAGTLPGAEYTHGLSMKKLDLFFWGRNLTRKKYISYAYDLGGGIQTFHLGDPQNYGVTARLHF